MSYWQSFYKTKLFIKRSKSFQLFTILLVFSFTLTSFSLSAEARWLWVKGQHKGEGCEALRQNLEKYLTERLLELTKVELTFDGQVLSCDSDKCAQARLLTIGGELALLNQSQCINGQLAYELRINSEGAAPLIYQVNLNNKLSKSEQVNKVYTLVDRVIKGPKLVVNKDIKQGQFHWGVTSGLSVPNVSTYDVLGPIIRLDLTQTLTTTSPWEIRYGLSFSKQFGDYTERQLLRLDTGIVYLPRTRGLMPWFSTGFSLGHNKTNHSQVNVMKLYTEIDLTVREKPITEQNLEFSPWLESGVILTTGSLQPHLGVRYHYFTLGANSAPELQFLFGVRWL